MRPLSAVPDAQVQRLDNRKLFLIEPTRAIGELDQHFSTRVIAGVEFISSEVGLPTRILPLQPVLGIVHSIKQIPSVLDRVGEIILSGRTEQKGPPNLHLKHSGYCRFIELVSRV